MNAVNSLSWFSLNMLHLLKSCDFSYRSSLSQAARRAGCPVIPGGPDVVGCELSQWALEGSPPCPRIFGLPCLSSPARYDARLIIGPERRVLCVPVPPAQA